MLILSRRPGRSIILDTAHGLITVKVVERCGNIIRLGITAPREVRVDREEIYDARQKSREAVQP